MRNKAEYHVHHHRNIQDGSVRAAIFGMNDGLVSNSALILGVAAADVMQNSILLAGVSGLLAGATSMAAGEYISMKAQTELIEREIKIEKKSLSENPKKEINELANIYQERGLNKEEAFTVANAIHKNPDIALSVHAREELGVDPENLGNPTSAAISSFAAFAIGALIPLTPWFFSSGSSATIFSLSLALIAATILGVGLAKYTELSMPRTVIRQVAIAAIACGTTYLLGSLFDI